MAAYPGILGAPPWTFLPAWAGQPFWSRLRPQEPRAEPPWGSAVPDPAQGVDALPRVAVELFVSPESPSCVAALRNIERALAGVVGDGVRLLVWDVAQHPERAAEAHVCFTPTLVIRAADQPPIWIFGALTDTEVLNEHLEVAGVQRRAHGD